MFWGILQIIFFSAALLLSFRCVSLLTTFFREKPLFGRNKNQSFWLGSFIKRFFSGKAEGFEEQDAIIRNGIAAVFLFTMLLLVGNKGTKSPLTIFQNSDTKNGEQVLAEYEAEDFYSNIADVAYEAVFEAEEPGVGHSPDGLGENVIDFDASAQRARWAHPTHHREGGYIVNTTIGANFAPGPYIVDIRIKLDEIDFTGDILKVEAYDVQKEQVLASEILQYSDFLEEDTYQTFSLDFSVERLQPIQVRVLYMPDAKTQTWVDMITISSQAEQQILYRRDQSFPVVGDESAFGKKARLASVGDPAGHIVFGINTKDLASGSYKAIFRIKSPEIKGDTPIAKIEVVDNEEPTMLFEHREIYPSEIAYPNVYQDFEIDFIQRVKHELDFRVFVTSVHEVWLDRISIVPQ